MADGVERSIGELTATVKALEGKLDRMAEKVDRLDALSNRWKGAVVVLLALGGLMPWTSTRLFGFWHSS